MVELIIARCSPACLVTTPPRKEGASWPQGGDSSHSFPTKLPLAGHGGALARGGWTDELRLSSSSELTTSLPPLLASGRPIAQHSPR